MRNITVTCNSTPRTYKASQDISNAVNSAKWEAKNLFSKQLINAEELIKEITPSINEEGLWQIGKNLTYVKARADVITYSVETISGSPIMNNHEGAITVKAHIYYNLKDITSSAMKNGIKIQWVIQNKSGQSRKGVTDEEWIKTHSHEMSNTDTMTFTSDDFEMNCRTKIGFKIANEDELQNVINKINK